MALIPTRQSNVQLVRLDDSLKTVYQYFSPLGDMEQKPLGIVRQGETIALFVGEYDGNDSMYVIRRNIDLATGTERNTDTVARLLRKVSPYLRTDFGMAVSPDSSKVLVYNFDLTLARSIPPMSALADATLIDLQSGISRSMRFEVPMPDYLQQAGYNGYAPSRVVYHVMVANDGRSYFSFPGTNDSLALTCVNFEMQKPITLMAGLRNSFCVWEKPRYCRPHAMLDSNGDLRLAVLDYDTEELISGVSVGRFSGTRPSLDMVKHHTINPATLVDSSLRQAKDKLMTVAMVSNPATRGFTLLFQREVEKSYQFRSSIDEHLGQDQMYYMYGNI